MDGLANSWPGADDPALTGNRPLVDGGRRPVAFFSGLAVSALALLTVVGWLAGVPALVRIDPTLPPMHFNTAIGMLLCGAALVLVARFREAPSAGLGVLAAILAAGSLLQNLTGADFGIDTLFVAPGAVDQGAHPGRIGPATAVSFILTAGGIVALSIGRRVFWAVAAGWMAVSLALGVAIGTLIGYAGRIEVGFSWFALASMAPQSAFLFAVLGAALFFGLGRASGAATEARSGTLRAIAIVVVGASVSGLLAQALHGRESVLLKKSLVQAQAAIGGEIVERVASRVDALDRQGRRWIFAGRTPPEAWQADAESYLEKDAGSLQSVSWIGADGLLQRIVPAADNERYIGTRILPAAGAEAERRLQQARQTDGAAIAEISTFPNGDKRLLIVFPLFLNDGTFDGYLFANHRLGAFLEPALERLATDSFAVQIWEDGAFKFGFQDEDESYADLMLQTDLQMPGQVWNLRIWPTAAHAATADSYLPQAILIAGLVLTALLAAFSIVMRLARVRELQANATNRALSDEVERRTEAEAMLQDQARELQGREHELEAVNAELEAFSYSVSHDLRAPLRAMDGYCQALVEDHAASLDETANRYLGRIRAGSQRLSRLIDDLLALSRMTRGSMEMGEVDLSAIAEDIVEELREGERNKPFAAVVEPDLRAFGDERLLRGLLQNLIGNAWKFSRNADAPAVRVGRTRILGRDAFYVRDNGVGFDMTYADKLFQPFQRLHSEKEFEGTGIGLATVARIVRRHGGEVWAESIPGSGATIFFTLQADIAAPVASEGSPILPEAQEQEV